MDNLYFSKSGALVNWFKLPYYSFATLGVAVCRFTFAHILPHFTDESTAKKILFHAKKLKIREFHLESKFNSTIDYYKFRNYLVQPTINLPKIKVVASKKDLKEAVKHQEKVKRSLIKVLENATENEILHLAKKQNMPVNDVSLDELRETVSHAYMAKIPEANELQDTQFDGVCGMLVAQFAAERMKGKEWVEIAQKARKGACAKTSGMQILYDSMTTSNKYNLSSTLHKVYGERIKTINHANDNSKNLEKISNLKPGIYRFTFKTVTARHGILISKENGVDYILDPNIGLLACPEHKTEQLLKKIVDAYPKQKQPNQNLLKRLCGCFKKSTDANLEFQAFEFKSSSSTKECVRKALFGAN